MTEAAVHRVLCWGVIALSALVFVLLLFVVAPYGRHGRSGWGPTMRGRSAWVAMESVAALGFAAVYVMGAQRTSAVPLALLALWQLHYLYRAFIFPFRRRASDASRGRGGSAPPPTHRSSDRPSVRSVVR